MTVLVTYAPGAEGEAALDAGLEQCAGGEKLVVVLATAGLGDLTQVHAAVDELSDRLDAAELPFEVRPVPTGLEISEYVVTQANEHQARTVVFGLRRRTREQSLDLGAHARRVLLEVACPVLVVKSEV